MRGSHGASPSSHRPPKGSYHLEVQRYPHWGPSLWSFQQLPTGTKVEDIPLFAQDGGESQGRLYSRGGETTAVCLMHPREDFSRHYAVPALLEAGFAVFAQAGRWLNNDIRLIHEMLLCDVAEGMRALRKRDYRNVILLGSRGGGALYAFYQSQAATPAAQRLKTTAAADDYDLGRFEMPEADGLVQYAAHLGEGAFLCSTIDPSVTDEYDPLSCDPGLDMFNPDNGFVAPPKSSSYSREFLDRYRRAQRGRVARIDMMARDYIQQQRHFQAEMADPAFAKTSLKQQNFIIRRALVTRFLTINRTEADPAYCDPSIEPSQRDYGSFLSSRPDVLNYSETGYGRYQTPRAWLSTWSGLSSRANTLECIAQVRVPTLVVGYTGDHAVRVPATEAIHRTAAASDKELQLIDGNHLGAPVGGTGGGGRDQALAAITAWLRTRW